MDIAIYNSAKALLTAGIREQHSPRIGPTNTRTLDPGKQISQTPQERAAAMQQRAEMDRQAAETRASVIKQTGRDPMTPDKIDRTPMTEEEQAAYVQAWMDRITEGDAKFQQLVQITRQWESGGLMQTAQGALVDTSA